MGEIDTAQEWRRLQQIYAGMSEDELEIAAGEGYQLTDIARQALHAEIARRNLKVVVRLAPPRKEEREPQPKGTYQFNPAELPLRTVALVENRDEAQWVKATLNDAGIICVFYPGYVEEPEQLQFSSSADSESSHLPDFNVMVLDVDVERARHALRNYNAYFGKDKPDEELPQAVVHCPKCRSTEVVLQGFDSEAPSFEGDGDEDNEETGPIKEIDPPAPGSKFKWSCDDCGYEWEDDGVET